MQFEDFKKWFNQDFWRAFKKRTFPIAVPTSPEDRARTVREVYDSIISAKYAASIPEAEIIMNKGYGVARTIPVFCIKDYIVFYFCIKELEDVLCGNRIKNTFGGWTLGGRIRKSEENEIELDSEFSSARYAFNPKAWTQAFGQFNSLLFAQLDKKTHDNVLQFDLSNFYDCIRLDILERWIREESKADKGWIIALLFYFLNQWNRRNTGLHDQSVGLPQDALADCSRILANFYLQKYDRFAEKLCNKHGAIYFRYADDQMILLKRKKDAEILMLILTRHLDRFGLRVNQKKVDLWKTNELQAYRCRKIQSIFKSKGDNANKKLVNKFTNAYLKIPQNKLGETWNGGTPLLNRLLWAKIELLPRGQFEKLFSRYLEDSYLMRADFEKLTRINDLNSRRKKPNDMNKLLIKIGGNCVHSAFHFEVITYAKNTKNNVLIKKMELQLDKVRALTEHNFTS